MHPHSQFQVILFNNFNFIPIYYKHLYNMRDTTILIAH